MDVILASPQRGRITAEHNVLSTHIESPADRSDSGDEHENEEPFTIDNNMFTDLETATDLDEEELNSIESSLYDGYARQEKGLDFYDRNSFLVSSEMVRQLYLNDVHLDGRNVAVESIQNEDKVVGKLNFATAKPTNLADLAIPRSMMMLACV